MQRLHIACEQNNRDIGEMRILLATKDQTPEQISEAVGAGLHLCGENKVQELKEKAAQLKNVDVVWHFIGHLQTNKVMDCVQIVNCVQSVDRASLVDELERWMRDGRLDNAAPGEPAVSRADLHSFLLSPAPSR